MKPIALLALLIASSAACAQKEGKDGEAPQAPVKITEITLANPDFEEAMTGIEIPGWTSMQHGGEPAYEIVTDKRRPSTGKQAARITRFKEEYYGLIRQRLPAPQAGLIVELSADLRTDEVGPRGWRTFIHFEDGGYTIGEVESEPMTGTQKKWQRVTIRGPVPAHTRSISIGVELLDGGTGWIDDVHLRVIDDGSAKPVENKPHLLGLPRVAPKPKPGETPAEKPADQKKP